MYERMLIFGFIRRKITVRKHLFDLTSDKLRKDVSNLRKFSEKVTDFPKVIKRSF